MKKLLLSIALLAVVSLSYGQSRTFKPFKVDMGFGYGFGKAKGLTLHLEPKYSIKDEIAVGLRWELAMLASLETDGTSTTAGVSAISSYLVTGDYYFSKATFRPLVGLGMGAYNMGSISVTDNTGDAGIDEAAGDIGTRFGIAPRVGFELGHFRMGLEYNLITGQPENFNRNYFTAKLGIVFGGGRR